MTLKNSGGTTLSISSIALTGTNPGDFAQTNTCGSSVAAGGNCTLSVTFKPTASGSRTAAVTLTDNATGSPQAVSLSGTGAVAPPAITSATTASGTVGSAFSYQIAATNTPTGYGATGLPAGLTVNSGTGLISGTPTTAGTSTVALSATNSGGTGNATLTLSINLAVPVITSVATASGTTGSAFSYQITATNTPSSYGATGLPAGLTMNSATGLISGTPTAAATSTVTLSATNSGGTGNATLTLTINLAAPVITSATMASVRVGSTVSYQIAATSTPTSYGATGLPAGLSVNSGTGLITGTPTSTGTSTVTLSATNAAGTGTATLTLTIAAPLPAPFVQIIANKNRATPSSQSLSFPANTLVGDFILVAFGYNVSATASISDSQGNIFTPVGTQLSAPGGQFSQVYYATNIKGGADTVTVALSANSSYLDLYLTEYSGINPTSPIDVQASASGSGGTASSGNATTTVAGDVIYGYCLGSPVCTAGSGFAARSTFDGNVSEDLLAGSAGSYAATGSATAGWAMQMVALKPASSGTGSAPVASLSPSSLTFASQAVGATSAAQSITLNNTGNAALTLTSIALAGMNPGDFAQTNTCGSSVAAGANCTISVTFKPTTSGTRTAAVTLTDNATGSPQSVSLSGTGGSTGAVANISPSSLTFGNEPVLTVSSPQTVTLNNTGSAALNITSIALSGAAPADFIENNTCGSSVAAGGTCTIAILFTPSATGARTTSLTIADNASGSPQSVSLSGTGTHDVILTWTASPNPDVGGYNVYRGTTSGGESSTRLNTSPVPGTTFADLNVLAGQKYYYMVTAVSSDGTTQSSGSNEASATVPST